MFGTNNSTRPGLVHVRGQTRHVGEAWVYNLETSEDLRDLSCAEPSSPRRRRAFRVSFVVIMPGLGAGAQVREIVI